MKKIFQYLFLLCCVLLSTQGDAFSQIKKQIEKKVVTPEGEEVYQYYEEEVPYDEQVESKEISRQIEKKEKPIDSATAALIQLKIQNAGTVDSSIPSERSIIKADFQNQYKDPVYHYEFVEKKNTWWDDFKNWLIEKLINLFQFESKAEASEVFDILFYIFITIAIGILIFFIVKVIMFRDGKWMFKKKNKKLVEGAEHFDEVLQETNYAGIIAKLKQSQDYRLAVRYYFVWVLKELMNQELIAYEPDKTTAQYASEIKDASIKQNFEEAAYLFNYIWYGEFPITLLQFEIAEKHFLQLVKR